MPAAMTSRRLPARTDVAIVGGGPCGLATALALAKVLPKSSISIFEKAPTLTLPRGAGLGLAVNGLKSLQAIDPNVFDAVVNKYSTISSIAESRSIQGQVLKTSSFAEMHKATRERFQVSNVLLGWHELVQALLENLPEQVQVHTSTRFVKYEEQCGEEGGVKLHLQSDEDGEPTVLTAKLLVAADGYFSKVREQALGDGAPDFGGAMVWRARVDAEQAERYGFREGHTVTYFGANRVVVVYTAGRGSVVWTASCQEAALEEAGINWREIMRPCDPATQSQSFFERMAARGGPAKERLLHLFKEWDPSLLDLFGATEPSAMIEHGVFVRPAADLRPESFGKGRVVIVGDAAHPMRPTGQGTNQAFEDALLLGRYIQRDGGGFGLLDEFRRYRAARVQPIVRHVEVQGRSAYNSNGQAARAALAKAERRGSSVVSNLVGAAGGASRDGAPAESNTESSGTSSSTSNGEGNGASNGASNVSSGGGASSGSHGTPTTAEHRGVGQMPPAAPAVPATATVAVSPEGLIEDWDTYVYLGEDFSPLTAADEKVMVAA